MLTTYCVKTARGMLLLACLSSGWLLAACTQNIDSACGKPGDPLCLNQYTLPAVAPAAPLPAAAHTAPPTATAPERQRQTPTKTSLT